MILVRPKFLAALILPVLGSVGAAIAADAKPGEDAVAPASESRTISEWVVRFLGYMAKDKSEQTAQAHKFHQLAVEKGLGDLAIQCQPFMKDWRLAMALYEMAEQEAVREGKASISARKIFEQAEAAPIQGNNDSETGRVLTAKVAALSAMGKLEEARQVVPRILEPYRRALATANLMRHASDEELDPILKEINAIEIPEAQRHGWKFAADRMAKSGDTMRALELYRKILASAETHNNATTIAEVEPIVEPLFALGDKDSAKRAAALCVAFSGRTSPQAGWKVRDMVLAARALRATGQEDKAKAILDELPAATGKTDLYQFVRMGGWAATGFLVSGQEEKFDLALRDVVAIGRQHDHHRARAMAVLQVLAILIESGRPLATNVGEEIAKSAKSIEIDPNSPVNSRL